MNGKPFTMGGGTYARHFQNAISFGSQIRTYTLQPYRLVKDHRNNCEIGDTDAVLDGRIDKLLRDYLLWQHTNRQQQQQ